MFVFITNHRFLNLRYIFHRHSVQSIYFRPPIAFLSALIKEGLETKFEDR
jgi:hypothetical protein